MAVTVVHAFVNPKADGADPTVVRPSNWNEGHTVTGLATVAESGAYADLSGLPTLGTAAATAITDYATAAQGATADSALQPAGNGGSLTGLTKTQVGLANVDNTSDANKPVSTATQTALNLKANLASPTFTGTVSGVTAAMVGAPAGSGTSSGTNTGDQTSIVGITGSLAEFNTALTGADFATGGGTVTGASSGTNTGDQTISDATISTTDITTNNASTTKHGFLKKLSNVATEFMNGVGDWAVPAAAVAWGGITGTLSAQTDLQSALDAKQATLVSGTNIKTVNGSTLLGSGDLSVSADDLSTVLTTTSTVGANKQRVVALLNINDGGGVLAIADTGLLALV